MSTYMVHTICFGVMFHHHLSQSNNVKGDEKRLKEEMLPQIFNSWQQKILCFNEFTELYLSLTLTW